MRVRNLLLSGSCLALLVSAPALAQTASEAGATPGTADAATSPQGGDQVGDIVVTANRTSSTAQKTAVALSVYSKSDLAIAGVTSVQALQRIDPSVNVTFKTGEAYVAIRGVASTDLTEIGDPSVPIARDGFFTNRSYAIATSLYDMQRVEVLKGPQGTLFGRNSTGGLINIITQQPTDAFGGYVNIDAGNYKTLNAEAAVNIPIGDKIQVRASGLSRYNEGYRHLTVIDARGDDDRTLSGRLQVAAQPIDGLSVLLNYQHDDIDDIGDVAESTPFGVVPVNLPSNNFPNYQPTTNRLVTNRLRWQFSYDKLPLGLTLTYAGGRDDTHWNHAIDYTNAGGALQQFTQLEHPVTWNNEVRIATDSTSRFTAQFGYFGFSENNDLDSRLVERAGAFNGRNFIAFFYNVKTRSNAGFGQVSYKITDTIKLSGGARYTWDDKQRTGFNLLDLGVVTGGAASGFIQTDGNGKIQESKATFHAGIDWTPTNQTLVYAKFDTGYKAGGFNSNGTQSSIPYGPEDLKAFEIGTKNKFLDGHLLFNVDGFYTDYSGYQATQVTAVISSGSGVFNVGSAHIYGVEAQLIGAVDGFRVNVDGTYLHAKFSKDVATVADGAGNPQFIAGNRLPNAPSLVVTGGAEYALKIGDASIIPRVSGKYSSSLYFSAFNNPDEFQGKYFTGDASIRYEQAGGHLTLEAYVRNFTDKAVLVAALRNGVEGLNNYQFQPPRTFGMRVGYSF